MAADFDVAFQADPKDAAWSARDQRAATARLQAALPDGSSLRSFECRESLCKIQTFHRNTIDHSRFVREGLMNRETQLWNAAGSAAIVKDESAQSNLNRNGPFHEVTRSSGFNELSKQGVA